MSPLPALLLALLVSSSWAQDGAVQGTIVGSQALQPWLVGLTAVVVFLIIVVVLMIINRMWCHKKQRDEELSLGEPDKPRDEEESLGEPDKPSRRVLTPCENQALEEDDEKEPTRKANKTTSL
ncbi:small integral membrane protein 24 isoform X1 [Carettochelys insculpta]|uniref:small integral membrane protein 24 isoform X1 n=1 Tax=Carettochelys insculpta TaxID=44489 RepID=UPI003EC063CD